ncbi:toxin-antitoxin system TumE family protein [Candidatus Marithrix sp. Canyon 246]|uniref:toxin-antitoxin system TumE family protein n=1 Tax=Candidatus Marithrix sp. Canyon 246 TaxID=1827136 RepID=UPI00084A2975|nr:DUF6516 family protein [Candidatus Marithrix sp. Canyon 246]
MNLIITQHFDAVEVRIIQSPIIVSYEVVRREISPVDGKLRIKMALTDGGLAEFVAYVSDVGGKISLLKYSFHWQNSKGKLKQRWDNAAHHPQLPNYPHHVHKEDGAVLAIMTVPDIFYFIEQIEQLL